MSGSDLYELFARIKSQAQPSSEPQSQSAAAQSIWAAAPSTTLPFPPADAMTPVGSTPAAGSGQAEQERTNNLLRLLKFDGRASDTQAQSGPMAELHKVAATDTSSVSLPESAAAPASLSVSSQNLVAHARQQPLSAVPSLPSPLAGPGAERKLVSNSGGSQQDFLLNLLRRPNASIGPGPGPGSSSGSYQPPLPARGDTPKPETSVEKLAQSFADAHPNSSDANVTRETTPPLRHFGRPDVGRTSFEAPQPSKVSMFTHQNPFEQLHESSPLNRTPQPERQSAPRIEILKHDRNPSSQSEQPASKRRQAEADMAPPAVRGNDKQQTAAESVEHVGGNADRDAGQAVEQADYQIKADTIAPATNHAAESQDVSVKEKEKMGDRGVESGWESAEDSATDKRDFRVRVYNFPMKPFVSLTLTTAKHPVMPIRQEHVVPVVQAKKDFDQMDRNLVTASQSHIVYATSATSRGNCGFRIIRQDNGDYKHVFRASGERIFSVQLCGLPAEDSDVETVLGTGVNGSVYWTSLSRTGSDSLESDEVERRAFIMPAVATADEATSGSPVKTRAKCSSRHPEYFAMSRGKTIHLVAPEIVKKGAYIDPETRQVDSEKYLNEHGLRMNTAKACKDFCFSEDDSMIVTLDKSGTVKFWDIRDLCSRAANVSEGPHDPIELKEPVWSLTAVSSGSKNSDKPSVSSIMLLDKERAHHKSVALRYVLIGLKQNHTLQLWDLGLAKPVQELRFPHNSDADGICSLSYHPKTGIIAVGHPTRNSVYFIHLSAPKYSLPSMDQARYVMCLARQDPSLPRPDSTAIMSGLREFSLHNVGAIRSLDMLKMPVETVSEPGPEEETLFELYIMHSKGAVAVSVKRTDLGWNEDGKMVDPLDAVKEGVVEVEDLQAMAPANGSAPLSDHGGNAETPAKKAGVAATKRHHEPIEPLKKQGKVETTAAPNGPPQAKPSRQVSGSAAATLPAAVNPPLMTPDSYAMAAQRATPAGAQRQRVVHDAATTEVRPGATSPKPLSAPAPKEHADSLASTTGDAPASVSKHFDSLYQKLDADKRIAEAANQARQDAMLRLVSSTLTENVERSLTQIIADQIDKRVVPTVVDKTSKAVESNLATLLPSLLDAKVTALLPGQVQGGLSKELKTVLPASLERVLKDPSVQKVIADAAANRVAAEVQRQVSTLLQQKLPDLATQAAQKLMIDLESRTSHRLQQAEIQRQHDGAKIEELTRLIHRLDASFQNMFEQQAWLQQHIREMQATQDHKDGSIPLSVPAPASAQEPPASTDAEKDTLEQEVQNLTQLLMDGKYESATMAWLQSAHNSSLFDSLFVRVNPAYLQQISHPLLILSVCAVVTAMLDTSTLEARLNWVDAILQQLDVRELEIMDVAPRIMDIVSQRLQAVFLSTSERKADDPMLRRIAATSRKVAEVRRVVG